MQRIVLEGIEKKFKIGFKKNLGALARLISVFSGREPKKILDVLRGISFSANEGEIIGIIGKNGSGKTTLLKIIDNLLKPNAGFIKIDGENIDNFKLRELAKKIAYVPQITSVTFEFTAYEIALMGRNPYIGKFQVETIEDYEIIHKIFELTNCIEIANRNFNDLSGGEQQKIIFSRALVQEPKILLLDEPTTHLDIGHQVEILDLIRKLNYQNNLTVIMILHDLNLASQYASNLILLHKGGIFAKGIPSTTITEKNIWEVYGVRVRVTSVKGRNPLVNLWIK